MKLFTKLGFALLVMLISSSVLWAQSSARDIGPKKQTYTIASEALFDLQFEWPVGVGGGEAGIECDGINIYTTKWNGADFYRYQLDGTYIESFTISGASNVRDLAFNGTYFYGGAASTTVFEMDFSAQSLVSSFTAPTECRAIGYNEDDDVFYANNWGSAITVFDPAGTFVSSWSVGPTGDSYYGFAYDNYSTGAPYLWGYAQVGATLNELIQMQLPDGAETGVYFDVGSVVAVGTGIAGGMAIDDNLFTGYWTILGTSQNVNIWGLELCPSGAQPTNDVGVMAIVEPSSGVNLTASEPVIVKIKNYGTAAQSNFDVSFTLDAGTPVVETVTATINSGDTYDHTFATTVDLSAYGTYTFEACTDLTGDENPGNDCNTKVVENSTAALCVPVYTTGCTYGDGFTDFALEEIENYGSGCADLNGTGWSQYLGLGPASLEAGNTYDVIMASGYNNNFTSIWIDFNDDLDLTPDEMVLNNFEMVTAGILYTVPIDIPAGVPDGQHIMRARTNWNATCDDPCTSYSYGEAEDYYVVTGGGVVLDPPTDLTATFVPDDDIYLDWVAPGGGPTGSILCVDRDGSVDLGFTDDWPAIQAALDANALTYDYHEVTDLTQDGPDLATMQQYDLIIWFTGESWQNNQTMSNNDEANLGTFIAGGGNLLLSAQDYFYDRYSSAGSFSAGQFPYDYLGVASTTQDNWSIMAPDVADISGVAGSFADGITFQVQDIYTTDKEGLYIDQIVSMDQDLFEVTNPTPAGIAACQYDGGSFRTAFTTISLAAVTDAGILATVMGNAVSWLSGGDSDALLGYNVYRDNNLINPSLVTATEYLDENLASGTYEYCVTAVYDEGESACSNTASATVPGGGYIFCDDFESYNVGDQLVCVNPDDWTTWSGTPCNNEDPYIVDDGGNVVEVTGTNDLVYVMENYTSGFYTMTFDMLVPTGGDGYFNTLQEFVITPTWGMQVYFGHTNLGEGNIDAGGALAQMFTFDYDTWMAIKVTVDIDNDWGEFFLDDVLIHGWVWHEGCFGTGTLNQLGGNNFYAWDGGVNGNPLYRFDNYCLAEDGGTTYAPPENPVATVFDNVNVHFDWDAPSGDKGINLPGIISHPVKDQISDVDPDANNTSIPSDALFDLQFDWPVGVGGGEAGIETDGSNIYTAKWNGADFYKYDMDGTYISSFTVSGASAVRDLAYNGTYFYGSAATTTVFEMDFSAQSLVSSFTAPTECRAIAYNEDDDAFYANNWGSAITKFNMAGTNLGSFAVGPVGDSYYGFAYQGSSYCGDGPFLWGYAQVGATLNELIQMELPSGTETGVYFDVGSVVAVGTGIAGGLAIDNHLVTDYWTILGTSQNVNIWGLELCGSTGPFPIGYNIFRDGVLIDYITAPTTEYDDLNLAPGTYEYCVSAVYDGGESEQVCAAPVTIEEGYIFCDDFESYNVGDQLVCVNPDDWTTWSGTPCNNEDPYIVDDGGNVVEITGTNDLVYVIENYTSGFYTITFDMLVPTGGDGYFNTLQEFAGTNSQWGMQVYFGHTNLGEGNIDAGTALAQVFTFDYDTWMAIKVTVDIDNDWGEFFLDDVLIHGWIWSTGCFGTGTLNQLGGSNFYAWDGGVNGNPLYHFDNYCLGGPPPCLPPQNPVATLFDLVNVHFTWDPPASGDVLSYNVFRDGTNIGNTTNTEYDDLGLAPGTYEYCVSAVYDDCESEQVCAEPVTIPGGPPPPTNLVAVEGINGIDLTWEGIGGAEWIQWDDGQNASAVGLTNGGTFSVASHWEPADLTNYDGYTLSKISFFPNDENASYILKVWTGPNGTTEVLSQPLATFNVGEWNEVELDNPVTISASTDFWFGYETTHLAGTWPAGCDAGPAIQYKGDMILTAGTWESLYVLTGGALDYNWNLAGYVELSDGIVAPLIGREVVPSFSGGSFASAPESKVTTNQYSKFIPSSTKDLSYNVYFKPEGGSYDSIANTVNTYYTHTEFVIGWNYYYVTSLLNGVESIPSNEDSVLITSIEENIFYSTMIYPNPASDVVNIKSDFEINNVMVYNFAGQIVANEQVNSKFYQINTSQYNAGIYFFRIETDEGTISKRIIIE